MLLDGDAQQHPLYLTGNARYVLQLLAGHAGGGTDGKRHRHYGNAVIGIKLQGGHHCRLRQHLCLAFAFKNAGIEKGGIHAAFHDLRRQPHTAGRGIAVPEAAGIGGKTGIDALGDPAGNGQPDGLDDRCHRLGAGAGFAPKTGLGGIIAVAGVVINAKIDHCSVPFLQTAQHAGGGNIYGNHIFHRLVQYSAGLVPGVKIIIKLRQRIGAQHPYLLAQRFQSVVQGKGTAHGIAIGTAMAQQGDIIPLHQKLCGAGGGKVLLHSSVSPFASSSSGTISRSRWLICTPYSMESSAMNWNSGVWRIASRLPISRRI